MTSTLEPATAEQEIARIIRDELLLGSERAIPFDEPLGELGIGLDSLALVNLLTAVEAAFGVELSDEIWTARGPLSVNDLADIVRNTPRTGPPAPPVDAETPPLHGRMEQLEDSLRRRGAAGRAAWAAVRAAAPVKRYLFARTRHLLLERRLDDGTSTELAPPPGIELRSLAPGEKPDFSDLWAPVHARRSERVVERALEEGAIALVACEGSRAVALDLISETGDEEVEIVSPGVCYGFFLTEARAARGRGIGLALAAHSFAVARELGFRSQLTHVFEGNGAMLAAATQLLGFRTIGSAWRTRVAGITRWSWDVGQTRRRGPRLVL
jgi:acyl carrier protein/GNAT superfamily N-acetyltransferase